jgi:hypothetical protein
MSKTAKGHQFAPGSPSRNPPCLTKESALLKDIKILKELCEMLSSLPKSRYYTMAAIGAIFAIGYLLRSIAVLVPVFQ